MGSEWEDANVALFFSTDIRRAIAARADPAFPLAKGRIADREWLKETDSGQQPAWQIIIRDDGTDDVGLGLGDASIGVSILAGSLQNPEPAVTLARIVKSIIRAMPRVEPGNPVVRIVSLTGPTAISEASTYARQYLSCGLSVVGIPS